jgi:hypothetical protein
MAAARLPPPAAIAFPCRPAGRCRRRVTGLIHVPLRQRRSTVPGKDNQPGPQDGAYERGFKSRPAPRLSCLKRGGRRLRHAAVGRQARQCRAQRSRQGVPWLQRQLQAAGVATTRMQSGPERDAGGGVPAQVFGQEALAYSRIDDRMACRRGSGPHRHHVHRALVRRTLPPLLPDSARQVIDLQRLSCYLSLPLNHQRRL